MSKPRAASERAESLPHTDRWDRISLGLLAIGFFLAPILGGKVMVDAMPLAPGFDSIVASLWDGGETPILAHGLIALFVVVPLAIVLFRSKVVQTPITRLIVPLLILEGFVLFSTLMSVFRWQSAIAAAEWILYFFGFLAVVMAAGRDKGPVILLSALLAGCTLIATTAVMEYQLNRVADPTWRVFANWTHPNALAGMLLFGLFIGMGLTASQQRVGSLAAGAATVVIGFAFALTQSKGGYLAAVVGIAGFALPCMTWIGIKKAAGPALRIGATLAILAALLVAMKYAPRAGTAGQAAGNGFLTRAANAGATAEQSAGFRALLWKSALSLTQSNPLGNGIGTFRYYSSKPGIVPTTVNAHQSYLQLASEASVFAPIALLAFGTIWLWECFRGARKLPLERNILRAGCVAAILAAAAHNAVDSDLYFFGSGLALFLVMGVGSVLATDSLTPEQLPGNARVSLGLLGFLSAVLLLWFGRVEALKSRVIFDTISDKASVLDGAVELKSIAIGDGEAAYVLGRIGQDDPEKLLTEAARLGPTPKVFRALAAYRKQKGDLAGAEKALLDALKWDGKNMLALTRLIEIKEAQGNKDAALKTARRLIDVESTPYFQTRAIPEVMQTETYEARMRVAASLQLKDRAAMLEPAVEGYKKYLVVTVPYLMGFFRSDGSIVMAGKSLRDLINDLDGGTRAATMLLDTYHSLGDKAKELELEAVAVRFALAVEEARDLVK